jgi:hypothetical protein
MARLIQPDGTETIVTPKAASNEWTLAELQHCVQGHIERCPQQYEGHDVWVNEEGLILELDPNHTASHLLQQSLYGPVLILGADEFVT